MPVLKIDNFKGMMPSVADTNLPDNFATKAKHVNILNGDLVAPREYVKVDNVPAADRNKVFLPYDKHVYEGNGFSYVVTGVTNKGFRLYYTNDAVIQDPKAEFIEKNGTNTLGLRGSNRRDLGVPKPSTKLSVGLHNDSEISKVQTVERDAHGVVTLTLDTEDHGLSEGDHIAVWGFGENEKLIDLAASIYPDSYGGSTGRNPALRSVLRVRSELRSFNTSGAEVLTVAGGKVSYFKYGPLVKKVYVNRVPSALLEGEKQNIIKMWKTTDIEDYVGFGSTVLSGNRQIRTYVYTYINDWGEESIPSAPSNEVLVREGEPVKIHDILDGVFKKQRTGKEPVVGMNLYRSVTSAVDTDYFLVGTFLNGLSFTSFHPIRGFFTRSEHHLVEGDRVVFIDTKYTIYEYKHVTRVVDPVRFLVDDPSFMIGGGVKPSFFFKVLEGEVAIRRVPADTIMDWVDDIPTSQLSTILPSENYDSPPDGMQGLAKAHNNIWIGHTKDEVCFSYPDKPHAWPEKNRVKIDYDITDIKAVAGYILVLTTAYPYIVVGSDPETMRVSKLDALHPCSEKGHVTLADGVVVWVSDTGLISWSPSTGLREITRSLILKDQWVNIYKPSYISFHDGFCYTDKFKIRLSEEEPTGIIEDTGFYVYNPYDQKSYLQVDDVIYGDVETGETKEYEWQSKVFVLSKHVNLGVLKIIGTKDGEANVTLIIGGDRREPIYKGVKFNQVCNLRCGFKYDQVSINVKSKHTIERIYLAGAAWELRTV